LWNWAKAEAVDIVYKATKELEKRGLVEI